MSLPELKKVIPSPDQRSGYGARLDEGKAGERTETEPWSEGTFGGQIGPVSRFSTK